MKIEKTAVSETSNSAIRQQSNRRAGRSTADSHKHTPPQMTWDEIHIIIQRAGLSRIYDDTLLFAAEALNERGLDSAVLFHAETGELTAEGKASLHEAIEEAWQLALTLTLSQEIDSTATITSLKSVLSNRAVLDFHLAYVAEAEERRRRCLEARVGLKAKETKNN